jgi:hypothetical protein
LSAHGRVPWLPQRVLSRCALIFITAVALAAPLLSACGAEKDSSGAAPSAAATDASSEAAANNPPRRKRPAGVGAAGPTTEPDSPAAKSLTRPHPDRVVPLRLSGGGSAQFRAAGGDNSVQEYGAEAGRFELQEAATVVHRFYAARNEKRWRDACSDLSKSNIEQLEELAAHSPDIKGPGCGPALDAFTRSQPAAIQREITIVDAGSLRRNGKRGFLIYYGAHGVVYAMPLVRETGRWKLAAIIAATLPGAPRR